MNSAGFLPNFMTQCIMNMEGSVNWRLKENYIKAWVYAIIFLVMIFKSMIQDSPAEHAEAQEQVQPLSGPFKIAR